MSTNSYLKELESEAIFILREVVAEFTNPVMLYSVGKDSSVMLHLARKAFYPSRIPFPLLHVDTGYKFREMYEFRDSFTKEIGAKLIVHRNEEAIKKGFHPAKNGIAKCCGALKTQALLNALSKYNFNAAIGGARRDEEKSRAKERVWITHANSRVIHGQWYYSVPSRFIEELPKANIIIDGFNFKSEENNTYIEYNNNYSHVSSIEKFQEKKIRKGQRVFHQKFGYGNVIGIEGENIEVNFNKTNIKKVKIEYLMTDV